jgi:hypothetical protein
MPVIRYNLNTFASGEEYLNRLQSEADRSFRILLSLLSSYFSSTVDGPNYARELKSVALELSRLRLTLEDMQQDVNYITTRTEFLYQVATSMLFPQLEGAPNLAKTDEDFRQFLINMVSIFFGGSVPTSIRDAVELLTGGRVIVHEHFLDARRPGSGYDMSDEFGFTVDVLLDSPTQVDTLLADKNIRIVLAVIRPVHTLYRVRYVLQDFYRGNLPQTNNSSSESRADKVGDAFSAEVSRYGYEDFRRFVEGIEGVDLFGSKRAVSVVDEPHMF